MAKGNKQWSSLEWTCRKIRKRYQSCGRLKKDMQSRLINWLLLSPTNHNDYLRTDMQSRGGHLDCPSLLCLQLEPVAAIDFRPLLSERVTEAYIRASIYLWKPWGDPVRLTAGYTPSTINEPSICGFMGGSVHSLMALAYLFIWNFFQTLGPNFTTTS